MSASQFQPIKRRTRSALSICIPRCRYQEQVAKELPMGIPSKVAETSFVAAERLILVQFPDPQVATARATSTNSPEGVAAAGGNAPPDDGRKAAAAEASGGPGGGLAGRGAAGQHPMGVVCTCVRTGWSLMSSLFCIGEEVSCCGGGVTFACGRSRWDMGRRYCVFYLLFCGNGFICCLHGG